MEDKTKSGMEGHLALVNTIFFVIAAGLVAYALFLSMFGWESFTLKSGGMFSWGEKLLLFALAAAVAGMVFSVSIVSPTMRRSKQERTLMDRRAENLQKQATTDPLTGMHNRRYFEQALNGYLTEFNKIGATLGLLILDLDHFKNVNDNYGHDVGDLVLREVALRMRATCREHDIVARLGGEEFAVITPYATREDLLGVAERYRVMVESLKIKSGNVIIRPTVSIGVATNEDPAINADDLFKAADNKLYQAKNAGRNRVAA
jgi:diguanylate cyclase (GGDEF)-like protein